VLPPGCVLDNLEAAILEVRPDWSRGRGCDHAEVSPSAPGKVVAFDLAIVVHRALDEKLA
jgi:hypothetical protein